MKCLKPIKHITWDELPLIESPFFAKVDFDPLMGNGTRLTIWDYERYGIAYPSGHSYGPYDYLRDAHLTQTLFRCLEERIESGELVMITDDPFRPVAWWVNNEDEEGGGHWKLKSRLRPSFADNIRRQIDFLKRKVRFEKIEPESNPPRPLPGDRETVSEAGTPHHHLSERRMEAGGYDAISKQSPADVKPEETGEGSLASNETGGVAGSTQLAEGVPKKVGQLQGSIIQEVLSEIFRTLSPVTS